jgi:hypothetical protein
MRNFFNSENWSNQKLVDIDFSHSVFNDCNFSNVRGDGASFTNAVMNNCRFNNAHLRKCDFRNALLNSCNFANSDVHLADFTGAGINDCVFHNVDTDVAIGLVLHQTFTGEHNGARGIAPEGFSGQNISTFDGGRIVMSHGGEVFLNDGGVSISGGSGVRLVSGGISHIPFDPWVRVFSAQSGYRIECPGTSIRINGMYTFVNNNRFIHVGSSFPGTLVVSVGRVVDNQYVKSNYWELPVGEWCEIENFHY